MASSLPGALCPQVGAVDRKSSRAIADIDTERVKNPARCLMNFLLLTVIVKEFRRLTGENLTLLNNSTMGMLVPRILLFFLGEMGDWGACLQVGDDGFRIRRPHVFEALLDQVCHEPLSGVPVGPEA